MSFTPLQVQGQVYELFGAAMLGSASQASANVLALVDALPAGEVRRVLGCMALEAARRGDRVDCGLFQVRVMRMREQIAEGLATDGVEGPVDEGALVVRLADRRGSRDQSV